MEEYLANRVENLERAVARWRLASFALGILLLCSLACGGTFTAILALNQPDRRHLEAELQEMADREMVARVQADRAEEARKRAEQKLREVGVNVP